MKNKKLLFILVPVVVVVWGIIFYRIFNQIIKKNQVFVPQININELPIDEIKKDTFTIVANYRDPFLGSSVNYSQPENDNKKIEKKKQKTEPSITGRTNRRVRWPEIEYSGSIYNKDSKQSIAVMKIDNNGFLMYLNETNSGVTLLKIYEDSIRVSFEDDIKTILKTSNQ